MFLSSQHYCKSFNLHRINPRRRRRRTSPGELRCPDAGPAGRLQEQPALACFSDASREALPVWGGCLFVNPVFCPPAGLKSCVFPQQGKVKGVKNEGIKHFSGGEGAATVLCAGRGLCFV